MSAAAAAASGPPAPRRRRAFVLLGFDARTGWATTPVGVLGTEGDASCVSWVPHEPAAEGWRELVGRALEAAAAGGGGRNLAAAVEGWAVAANGRTFELAEVDPLPESPDMAGAVELVVDELLAARGAEGA